MPQKQDDNVIEFTAENGFVIENLAKTIVQMMNDLDMDAHITLPDGVVIEVERDCTPSEIIAGYKDYLAGRIKARPPSNER